MANEINYLSNINLFATPVNDIHVITVGYLNTALTGKADVEHNHSGADITSGEVGTSYLPKANGTGAGIVSVTANSGLTATSGALAVNITAGNGLNKDSSTGAISVSVGSTSAFGTVKVTEGNGLGISSGVISMAKAGNDPGAVKVTAGNGLAYDSSTGAISVSVATTSAAGTVQLASSIAADGTGVPTAGTVYSALQNYVPTSSLTTTGGTGQGGKVVQLDSSGLIDSTMVPKIAITDTFTAASESAMTALSTAEQGDICIRTDLNKTFILTNNTPGTASNWKELATPTDAVISVNGETGAVVLDAGDVGAIASSALVTSVSSSSTNATVPSALAVYSFVSGNYSATGHGHTLSDISDAGTAAGCDVYDISDPSSAEEGMVVVLDSNNMVPTELIPYATSEQVGGVYLGNSTYDYSLGADLCNGLAIGEEGRMFMRLATAGTSSTAVVGTSSFDSTSFTVTNGFVTLNDLSGTYALASHTHAFADLPGVTSVSSSSDNTHVPSALAVYTFVNTNYSAVGHTHTLANITDAGTAAAADTGTSNGNVPVLGTGGKLATSVIPRYDGSVTGDGTTKEFTITHSLGVKDVQVTLYDNDGNICYVAYTVSSTSALVLHFANAPASGVKYRVVVTC